MAFLAFIRALLLPLLAATLLYALATYVLLPLYRRHRTRYSQYLPLPNTTADLDPNRRRWRDRVLAVIRLPSAWALASATHAETGRSGRVRRGRWAPVRPAVPGRDEGEQSDSDDENSLFGDEEGEGMVGFDVLPHGRASTLRGEAMSGAPVGGDGRAEIDSARRLSRELEEGFRDDSSEEDDERERERRGQL